MIHGAASGRIPAKARRSLALVAIAILLTSCAYLESAVEHQQANPTSRPWWCHSTGDGGHAGGHGDHGGDAYAGVVKGMLSWDHCVAVSAHFDLALAYAQQYPTAGDAEAAGFHAVVPYVAGMGTHHVRVSDFGASHLNDPALDPHDPRFANSSLDENFDPTRAEFLMYDGNGPDAKLVGMAWYVRTAGGHPPAGFHGDNDWWHVHPRLCFERDSVTFRGQNLSDADCASRDGVNLHLHDYWMAHAWIVPGWTHHPDVFVNHHPCLLSGGPAPADHSCWEMAGGHSGH